MQAASFMFFHEMFLHTHASKSFPKPPSLPGAGLWLRERASVAARPEWWAHLSLGFTAFGLSMTGFKQHGLHVRLPCVFPMLSFTQQIQRHVLKANRMIMFEGCPGRKTISTFLPDVTSWFFGIFWLNLLFCSREKDLRRNMTFVVVCVGWH